MKMFRKYFMANDDLGAWFKVSGSTASIRSATAKPCKELTKSGQEIAKEEQGKNGYIVADALITGVVKFAWSRNLPIAADGTPIIPGYISGTAFSEIFGEFLPLRSGDWSDRGYKTLLGEEVPEPTWSRPEVMVGYGTLADNIFFFTEPKHANDVIIAVRSKDFRADKDFNAWCSFVTKEIDAKVINQRHFADENCSWLTIIAPKGKWADAAARNRQQCIDQLYDDSKEAKEEYDSRFEYYRDQLSVINMSLRALHATYISLTKGEGKQPDTVRLNAGRMNWEYVVTPARIEYLGRILDACKAVATSNKVYECFNPEALYLALAELGKSSPLF